MARDEWHWCAGCSSAMMRLLDGKKRIQFPPGGLRMIATAERTHTSQERSETADANLIVASLEGVNKNYGDIRALRGVDFQVRSGEVVALLGPNGAGKTTAVKLLLGLMQPDCGSVRVFGGDPTNPANRMRTGAMLQVGRVPETLRVREHIDLFSSYYQKPMPLAEILAAAGLEQLSERKFGDLSGGQRQRTRALRSGHLWRPRHAFSRRTHGRAGCRGAPLVVG
jgi:ABC-type glutathione transport system ATPase component